MKHRLVHMAAVGTLALGCAAEGDPNPFRQTPTDSGVAMDSSFPNINRDAAIPIPDRGLNTITPDAACATTTSDTRRVPVNLLIVLDRSGSMNNTSSNPTKWVAAVNALRGLLTRLDDEIRIGLTLFPATSGATDQATTYARPIVPINRLGANRAQLLATLSGASPNGGTPMACALRGAIDYYRTFSMDGARNVILITDGAPTQECTMAEVCFPNPLDIPGTLACIMRQESVASDAVRVQVTLGTRETTPVRTYVTGTPEANDGFLSDLAVNGGTPRTSTCRTMSPPVCHYSLQTGTFEADLTRALDDIRGRALTCEFEVNVDPTRVDPTRVNVNFTGSSSPTPVLIPRDVEHRNGWDYSNGMRSVVLYGAACERVRSDAQARVQILFGCPTVTPK